MHLKFLGANQTVTGSRYLLDAGGTQLLVDCGQFQGYKSLRLRNWAEPPFDPRDIAAVLLTHAHLDHSGMLPRLVRQGFDGPILATTATRDLCRVLLEDAAKIQEEDARYANEAGYSRHHPAEPLFGMQDAQVAMKQFRTVGFDEPEGVAPGVVATWRRAGHLLGAASLRVSHEGRTVVFSGDLGRPDDALMHPPVALGDCNYVVCESTYGDRVHPTVEPEAELGEAVRRVAARGGVIVVPAFAVGRAQAILLYLSRLKARHEVPASLPVFLDSPMAIDVTSLYRRYSHEHRLSSADYTHLLEGVTLVRDVPASQALQRRHGPMVIVSASGMATGGRVVHHLKSFAPDPRNAIVLAGYQAGGTRGASLAAGAATVRIHGADVPVRAEVVQLTGSSAHADSNQLIDWLKTATRAPKHVFVTHGEPDAADALRARIEHELGWSASVPDYRDRVALD